MDTMSVLDTVQNETTGFYFIAVLLASVSLWYRCPDARKTLLNTLYLLGLGFIGLTISAAYMATYPEGNTRIYHAGLVLVVGAAVIRLFGLFLFRVIFVLLRIHPPSILEEILVVIAYFVWAMLQFHDAGVPLGEIITTSAIATAVLAFAMQDTLGNILGGLALQWDHSLKVGDWIQFDDVEGRIIDVKWRAISLETRNWETVVIPNSLMMKNQFKVLGERSGEPVRWRRWVWFYVDYSVPPEQVIELAEDAVNRAMISFVAAEPRPNCLLMDITGSSAKYAMRYWLTNLEKDDPTDSTVRQHIYAALNRLDIRLAMPKQHLYLTNRDEPYLEQKREAELRHRVQTLSDIDLFHAFSTEELEHLARHMDHRPYAEGDTIFQKGEHDPYLYIITQGQASVHVEDAQGAEQHAFSLGPGEFLGEVGLMTGKPRAATVRASSALQCYVVGKEEFASVLLAREELMEEISKVAISRQNALQKAHESVLHGDEQGHADHGLHDLLHKMRHFLDTESG
jgi:small-conductance mechanosensitive channel